MSDIVITIGGSRKSAAEFFANAQTFQRRDHPTLFSAVQLKAGGLVSWGSEGDTYAGEAPDARVGDYLVQSQLFPAMIQHFQPADFESGFRPAGVIPTSPTVPRWVPQPG